MIEREERITAPMAVMLDCTSGRREVRLSDISTGGCYIDSIAPVQPDENVDLKLVLDNGEIEEMSGTVVYVHPGMGFGVRFNELSERQKAMIEHIIQSNGGRIS